MSVERLDGKGEFALARLESSSSPTLLWFWAPWCEYCNAEAPSDRALRRRQAGELKVVAIGGDDEPERGLSSPTLHRLRTPTLLFDETTASFDAYRIRSIPTAVLLDRTAARSSAGMAGSTPPRRSTPRGRTELADYRSNSAGARPTALQALRIVACSYGSKMPSAAPMTMPIWIIARACSRLPLSLPTAL